VGCATCRQEKPRTAARLRLLTKKEKTGFFLLCGKQVKINVLIFRIFFLCFIHPVCDRMGFVSSLSRALLRG
jgi:hypothetical protein